MSYIYERVTAHYMADCACRMDRYDQLGGYEGINALHDYLEQLAEDMGEPLELDIIALCCEWAHYDSLLDAAGDYFSPDDLRDVEAMADDVAQHEDLLDWFRDRTTVLELDNGAGYLIGAF